MAGPVNSARRLWAVSRIYPPNYTGAGIQAHREYRELARRGWKVHVLTSGISAAAPLCCKKVDMDGVLVDHLPAISYPRWINRLGSRFLYKILFLIYELLGSFSYAMGCVWRLAVQSRRNDIIVYESLDSFLILTILAARAKGLHSILRMNLLDANDPHSRLVRARKGQVFEYLKFLSFPAADVLVAISSAMLESCRKAGLGRKQIQFLSLGADTEKYRPVDAAGKLALREKLGLETDKKYIVFVGSAIERKGIDVMVEAFLLLKPQVEEAELLLVGPNEFDPRVHYNARDLQNLVRECREKIEASGYSQAVHWIGHVDNVQEYMQVADVFCLPTRREGFGLVIIEAMAVGLPVIVARLEGITTDILPSEEAGRVIAGYQARDYAEAIQNILADPLRAGQIGRAARQRVLAEFSLAGSIEKWLALFDGLLRGQARSADLPAESKNQV